MGVSMPAYCHSSPIPHYQIEHWCKFLSFVVWVSTPCGERPSWNKVWDLRLWHSLKKYAYVRPIYCRRVSTCKMFILQRSKTSPGTNFTTNTHCKRWNWGHAWDALKWSWLDNLHDHINVGIHCYAMLLLSISCQKNYDKITNMSLEAREKLTRIQPETVGQASRISGVSPVDISMLIIYIESGQANIWCSLIRYPLLK